MPDETPLKQEVAHDAQAGEGAWDALDAIERAMVRLRRSISKRALGRAAGREFGSAVDLTLMGVVDAVDEGPGPEGEEVTVGEVARRLGIDPSRASRAVAAAVDSGHLRRVASQRDARRIGLELTDRGRALVDAMRAFRRRMFGRAMEGWSEQDMETFARLLTRFVAASSESMRGPSGPRPNGREG